VLPMAGFGKLYCSLLGLVPMVALRLSADKHDELKVNFTLAALEAEAPFAKEVSVYVLRNLFMLML
jgi:hypothetical protein